MGRRGLWLLILFLPFTGFGQGVRLAKLKYNGGGDWYANKTALPNLMAFCNRELKTNFPPEEDIVEVGSPDLFNYPWVYLTGHGEVLFSDAEARNLRKYLLSGGFLHVDDNYGLDPFIRREMKKVFPELDFERVYNSDMKKMIRWYQILKANNVEIKLSEYEEEETAEEAVAEPVVEEAPKPKKTRAKKAKEEDDKN